MFAMVRAAVAVPMVKVADCESNAEEIISIIKKADKNKVDILTFPEMSVTAYTCADLLLQNRLLESAEESLNKILTETQNTNIFTVVGLPLAVGHKLYNCAVAFIGGRILGVVPKTYMPDYGEFYEKRWFSSGAAEDLKEISLLGQKTAFGSKVIFCCENMPDLKIGIEICEDLCAVIPPSSYHAVAGATVILNPSASNELSAKRKYRRLMVKSQSARSLTAYCYAGAGMGESTTDVVFGGHSLICEKGEILRECAAFTLDSQLIFADTDISLLKNERLRNKSFVSLDNADVSRYREISFRLEEKPRALERIVAAYPFIPQDEKELGDRCREIFGIQVAGIAKRLEYTGIRRAVIGVSGGLDSTLALLTLTKAFDFLNIDRKNILGITMPGFGTTDETYDNAVALMKSLGVGIREIPIKEACLKHFEDIGHDAASYDTTYENVQARERTQVLMDIANKESALVIGTGDLSEIALGWSTYNGDHMSMYSVNCGVPKTLIKYLVGWIAEGCDLNSADILRRILVTPISPELLPPDEKGAVTQITEDIIGPYELHDFYLYYFMRHGFSPEKIIYLAKHAFKDKYDEKEIGKWLKVFYKRFFTQQYKRSCMPDGPKVGSVALSPRGDLRMPSDAEYGTWIKGLTND